MIKIHEVNRQHWNNQATTWEERLNRDGHWHRCHKEPELAFEGETLATIREIVGDLRDKQVCVIGSGDNMAAYATFRIRGSRDFHRYFRGTIETSSKSCGSTRRVD